MEDDNLKLSMTYDKFCNLPLSLRIKLLDHIEDGEIKKQIIEEILPEFD